MSKVSLFHKYVVELGKLQTTKERRLIKNNPLPIHLPPHTNPRREKPFWGKKRYTHVHAHIHTHMHVCANLYCRLM